MMLTDKLALRWQFESATKEFQDKYWKQMLDEFVAAWKWKHNRYWIKKTVERFSKARPDLKLKWQAHILMPDFDEPLDTWKKFAK